MPACHVQPIDVTAAKENGGVNVQTEADGDISPGVVREGVGRSYGRASLNVDLVLALDVL